MHQTNDCYNRMSADEKGEKMGSRWITKVVSKDKTWTVVSTIAAMISAACAGYAVRQTHATWQQQLEGNRPYFALEKPGIRKTTGEEGRYEVVVPLENVGVRPASCLEFKLIVVRTTDTNEPEFVRDYSCANDIPAGQSPTPGGISVSFASPNVNKRYFVVSARYVDTVTRQTYVQSFYMTWTGLDEGKGQSSFAHAKRDEAERLAMNLKHLMWQR